MKLIFLSWTILFVNGYLFSQNVVTWNFSSKKISDKTYEIHLTATIDESWHIYSQKTPKGGPLPVIITFSKNPLLQLINKPKEVGEIEMYHDETFDVDVYAFEGKVDFVQLVGLKVRRTSLKVKTNLSGTVEFMACTKQQCLTPQKVKFDVVLQ